MGSVCRQGLGGALSMVVFATLSGVMAPDAAAQSLGSIGGWFNFDPAPLPDYWNWSEGTHTYGLSQIGYTTDDTAITSRYTVVPYRSVRSLSLWHQGYASLVGTNYPSGNGNMYVYGNSDSYGNASCQVHAQCDLPNGQTWTAFDQTLAPNSAPFSKSASTMIGLLHKEINVFSWWFVEVDVIVDLCSTNSATAANIQYVRTPYRSWTDTEIAGHAEQGTGLVAAVTADVKLFSIITVAADLLDPRVTVSHAGVSDFDVSGTYGSMSLSRNVSLNIQLNLRFTFGIGGWSWTWSYTWLNYTNQVANDPIASLSF